MRMDTPGITGEHLAHFERNGFFLIPNPFGSGAVRQVATCSRRWSRCGSARSFPKAATGLPASS